MNLDSYSLYEKGELPSTSAESLRPIVHFSYPQKYETPCYTIGDEIISIIDGFKYKNSKAGQVTILIPHGITNDILEQKLQEIRDKFRQTNLKLGESFSLCGITYTVLQDID